MQRFISIVMLFLATAWSVTPRGDVHELGEVGNLVQHFMEHRQTDGASLLAFLESHYAPGGADHHNEAHERLPLKPHAVHHVVCSDMVFSATLPDPHVSAVERVVPVSFNNPRSTPGPLPFQPPRP